MTMHKLTMKHKKEFILHIANQRAGRLQCLEATEDVRRAEVEKLRQREAEHSHELAELRRVLDWHQRKLLEAGEVTNAEMDRADRNEVRYTILAASIKSYLQAEAALTTRLHEIDAVSPQYRDRERASSFVASILVPPKPRPYQSPSNTEERS